MNNGKSFFTKKIVELNDRDRRPRLALTLGDPAGIGPEVILKALADPEISRDCDITVVGSRTLLAKIHADLSEAVSSGEFLADPADLAILNVDLLNTDLSNIQVGKENVASGAASFVYMETAIARTLAGEFQAIVTGPIAKSAWNAAGYHYPGQTELLAKRSGVERFGMMFVARSPHTDWTLRTLLATTHIPICQVSGTLTPQLMSAKLDLLVECLQRDFGIEEPRIAIAGLNPHSGERGQLGTEEVDWLIPWLEKERQARRSVILDGPVPPDTMWVTPGQAWYGNRQVEAADGYLALYHDQGLIPVKLMAFDRAVNTTIGLPFIRTSPDHGTAFDIAGKGIADATSMKAALRLAVELANQRERIGNRE